MSLEVKDIVQLAVAASGAKNKPGSDFSFRGKTYNALALNETLREEINSIAPTYNAYRRNDIQCTLFEIMEQTIEEILPIKVMQQYSMFAEVKNFAQGDTVEFHITGLGKKRAKQFVTRVGLAGIYEVFKLDKTSFGVQTNAYGGAAQIGFEEFLDGKVDFATVVEIIMEGLDELIYAEIAKALVSGISQLPEANKKVANGFDAPAFESLIAVARAYGDPAIYCTYEFAAKILPEQAWVSDEMRNQRNAQGIIPLYKGTKIVVLPQSFTDETNSQKVIDPSYAWIIPTGGNDKPVKIAFEGSAIANEFVNRDYSRELQIYKKFGVGVMMTNNICSYQDTSLAEA